MHASPGRPAAQEPGNLDPATVEGFGEEWSRFDQRELADDERARIWEQYFAIFPWDALPERAVGFDLGCGSGRWAVLVAPRVGTLHCVDASAQALDVARRGLAGHDNCAFHLASVDALPERAVGFDLGCGSGRWAVLVAPRVGTLHCVDASAQALDVARRGLAGHDNCAFHLASVDALPFADGSMDFGYSLGVLHHVPNTRAALGAAVRALKPGAPFLVYLYYAFDNRPRWYRGLWRATDLVRRVLSRSPLGVKVAASTAIAAAVYLPLARAARLLGAAGMDVERLPLSYYRERSFYTMRTDAFDRFSTRLEHRFTAREVVSMMRDAGLTDVVLSPSMPYWCAVGRRAGST